MGRLRSCRYCGKIHLDNIVCSKKPKDIRKKKRSEADRFRGLQIWKKKRAEIKERDNFICQLCYRNLYNTVDSRINYKGNIQVHHIEDINSNWDKRLDNNNLLCLCKYHHEMADNKEIDKIELLVIAKEQEEKLEKKYPPYYFDSEK